MQNTHDCSAFLCRVEHILTHRGKGWRMFLNCFAQFCVEVRGQPKVIPQALSTLFLRQF